jgi:hypothetical protein
VTLAEGAERPLPGEVCAVEFVPGAGVRASSDGGHGRLLAWAVVADTNMDLAVDESLRVDRAAASNMLRFRREQEAPMVTLIFAGECLVQARGARPGQLLAAFDGPVVGVTLEASRDIHGEEYVRAFANMTSADGGLLQLDLVAAMLDDL